jgi:hypothetical protein
MFGLVSDFPAGHFLIGRFGRNFLDVRYRLFAMKRRKSNSLVGKTDTFEDVGRDFFRKSRFLTTVLILPVATIPLCLGCLSALRKTPSEVAFLVKYGVAAFVRLVALLLHSLFPHQRTTPARGEVLQAALLFYIARFSFPSSDAATGCGNKKPFGDAARFSAF